jgi:RNA polymerase sigma factor (sigma-70 family)
VPKNQTGKSSLTRKEAQASHEQVLLEKYTPLVRRVAHALMAMKPAFLDKEDVVQDGMIGLLRAIRSNRGNPNEMQFASFANLNIRGAIIDGYRSVGEISRTDYTHAKQVRQAVADGKTVPAEEIRRAEQLLYSAWSPPVLVDGLTEETFHLNDPSPSPEQRAISNQLLRRAVDSLQQMSVRDRSIFIACELQGEPHVAVAQRYQLSNGRISQIIKHVRENVLQAIA